MKKTTIIFLSAMLLLAVSCNDKEIEAINQRLDNIENVSIASLQAQLTQMSTTLGLLQSTQTQLSGYVTSLQTSVGSLQGNYSSLQSAVTALQQKDQTFESNLQDLQDAIGDSANDVKRWVESSYATLQQFTQVQTDITGIKTDIQSIFTRLNGLDQATQTIANNLRDATADLTGKLGECQEDIAGILEDLEALQGDMDTVKQQIAAIISAVQSVVVVPDFTDGSVKMTDEAENIIRFEVYPLSAAENLATLGVSALSLDYVETETKSGALANIPLTTVSFDGEFLNVTADGTGLKDEVKEGTVGANARLRISDGTVVKSSEYFLLSIPKPTPITPIDLGLSVKWGSFNLGASSPEEYGEYYAWGETEQKSDYSWLTYEFGTSLSGPFSRYNTDSSYGPVDNQIILWAEDDVVHTNLGGAWRLPTVAEFSELIYNTNNEWTTYNDMAGYKFTSKTNSANWIFLPAAGEWYNTSFGEDGAEGCYWSSTLYTGPTGPKLAYRLRFESGYAGVGGYYRFGGMAIRPVYVTTLDGIDKYVPVASVEIVAPKTKIYINEEIQFTATVLPEDAKFSTVMWTSSDEEVASVNQSGYVKGLKVGESTIKATAGGVEKEVLIKVAKPAPAGTVDLGLSICWARCNLGASSPEEFGDYYAWGETEPYYTEGHSQDNPCSDWRLRPDQPINGYTWDSYTWCADGISTAITRYCPLDKADYWAGSGSPDGKTEFKDYSYVDDAARANLGGQWRMPTNTEFRELIDNCEAAFVTLNGVNGLKLTSREPGYTDKWIFLPAIGYRIYNEIYFHGSYGLYWSSSLGTSKANTAFRFYFDSSSVRMSEDFRCSGVSVRPVCEE